MMTKLITFKVLGDPHGINNLQKKKKKKVLRNPY